MVNIVVRHSSSQLGSGSGGLKRSTKSSSYDRTVPSPIRIPSMDNARAVSPLTTTESLFGGASAAIQAATKAVETSAYHRHHHNRPSTSSPVGVMIPEARYGTPTRAAAMINSTANTRPARDPSPHRGLHNDVRVGASGGIVITGTNNNHDSSLVEPECDYDTDVTALYELLESSEWEAARLRCRTHPKEVRTWIVRHDGKSSKVRWKLLPLHAAVIFQAPTSVVTTLLDQYPLAAAKRDDQGMLPLHLAFRHNQQQDEALLELLLEQYPKGVIIKDRRDRYPLDHGKETQFSSHFMHIYANAHAMCQNSPKASTGNNENDDFNSDNAAVIAKAVSSAAANEREKLIAKYDTQIQTLKSMYDERIDNMKQEHRAQLEEARRSAHEEERAHATRHTQELDELRDLLSQEVSNGQRVPELEHQVDSLKVSLEQSTQDMDMLRSVLHDQKVYEDELKDQLRKVLAEQRTLQDFIAQQQEQAEQAHQMREQMLRNILQKESETWHKSSQVLNMEMAQASESIRLRTESLLSSAQRMSVSNAEAVANRDDEEVQEILNHKSSSNVNSKGVLHSKDSGAADGGWEAQQHMQSHAHDDDISAITENSNF